MAIKKNAKVAPLAIERAVLVTTAHRGVFFGYMRGEPNKDKIKLARARNCVSWSTAEKGVFGLAVTGPGPSCRVGPAVPDLTLLDITSVAECSSVAVQAWESGPWTR